MCPLWYVCGSENSSWRMHDGQILKNERMICGGCYMVMKFRAHETFFIRKGWLSKGMKAIKNDPMAFISKEKNPMDTLGIGSNMVKSLRYVLLADTMWNTFNFRN